MFIGNWKDMYDLKFIKFYTMSMVKDPVFWAVAGSAIGLCIIMYFVSKKLIHSKADK